MREAVHDRKRVGDKALCRRMLLHQLEEFERERIAVLVDLRDIAATLQAEQHAEYLGDGAVELAGNFAFSQAFRLMREQLDYIETFFKSGRGVVHYLLGFSGCRCAWLFHFPSTWCEQTLDRV